MAAKFRYASMSRRAAMTAAALAALVALPACSTEQPVVAPSAPALALRTTRV